MANMKVKTAVNKNVNQHDNSGVTITTLDFGKVCVSKFLKCRQGDRFKIDYSMFARLAPMAVPTYGRFMLRTHAFFVPKRVVWPSYDKWLVRENDPSISSSPLRIKAVVLSSVFLNSTIGYVTSVGASSSNFDFKFLDSGGNAVFRIMTPKGKQLYSILRGLGYVILPFTTGSSNLPSSLSNLYFDMSPMLAFFRCFFDWLYPSTYVQQQGFGRLFSYDSHEFVTADLVGDSSSTGLFDLLFVSYDHDFYVDLWQDFNAPVSNEDTVLDVKAFAPDSNRAFINTQAGAGEYELDKSTFVGDLEGSSTRLKTLSAYGLRMLQSVSDYWTRHNLVGSRFLERAQVQYGFVNKVNRHNYSEFLKTWSDDIMTMDVTQTSQSSATSMLGEQAGKGISKGAGSLKFEVQEDGYLIFVSHLVPKIGYVQGLRPWCRLPLSPFDEFTPELEDVGMAPVPKSEMFGQWRDGVVFGGIESDVHSPYKFDGVFGFGPRYSEYKRGFDELQGDFIVPHLSTGGAMDSYHTFRIFAEPSNITDADALVFTANDKRFRQVGNQYDRVFSKNPISAEGSNVADHFYCYFGWNITRYNTMKPMLATIPLFDKSGQEVNASYLGEQLH